MTSTARNWAGLAIPLPSETSLLSPPLDGRLMRCIFWLMMTRTRSQHEIFAYTEKAEGDGDKKGRGHCGTSVCTLAPHSIFAFTAVYMADLKHHPLAPSPPPLVQLWAPV